MWILNENIPLKISFSLCYCDLQQFDSNLTLCKDCLEERHVFFKDNNKESSLHNQTQMQSKWTKQLKQTYH